VCISWKEDFGVGARGAYFDSYGIIRDVMQNHLLQILALVAMEPPRDLSADAVSDAKVEVLRQVPPAARQDTVIGQYRGVVRDGIRRPSYVGEPRVARESLTPTFAATVLRVNSHRWQGVPFFMAAGKAMDARLTEIRVRFRAAPRNLFCNVAGCPPGNELVIRVQPDESIRLRIVNKVPGLQMALGETDLNLLYSAVYREIIPDAYERLLLDVLRGDRSLFIRADELEAAWDVFTPLLHDLDEQRARPDPYDFGSSGPPAAEELARTHGLAWHGSFGSHVAAGTLSGLRACHGGDAAIC